jgi:hypothetical protein
MRFRLSNGDSISARQAWHDAFITGVGAIDIQESINSFNVQFSAKGSDGCTMDHCDKGKIQQVINTLRAEHNVAWAWGMMAYAPDGTENNKMLRNTLFPFLLSSVTSKKFNAYLSPVAGKLAYIAMADSAIEARSGARTKRRWQEMAHILKCSVDEYEKNWVGIFLKMKDALKDLDGVALPPIAHAVGLINDKADGDKDAVDDLAEFLQTPSACGM